MTKTDDGGEDTESYRQSIAVSHAKRELGEHISNIRFFF